MSVENLVALLAMDRGRNGENLVELVYENHELSENKLQENWRYVGVPSAVTPPVSSPKHLLETTSSGGDSPKNCTTAVKSSFHYCSAYLLLRKYPRVEASLGPG